MVQTPSAKSSPGLRSKFDGPPEAEWLTLDTSPITQPATLAIRVEAFDAQFSSALGSRIVDFLNNPIVTRGRNIISDNFEGMEFNEVILQYYFFLGRNLHELFDNGSISRNSLDEMVSLLDSWRARLFKKTDFIYTLKHKLIEGYKTEDSAELTDAERWALVDEFAAKYPGAPVSTFAQLLFSPAYKTVEAPGREPAEVVIADGDDKTNHPPLWADRESGDTPVSFVRKHYGVWRDGVWDPNGLTRPDLRHDRQLYNSLANYERRHPEEALNLPTKKQVNDAWVQRVLNGEEVPSTTLEKERFAITARRRGIGVD